MTDINFHDAIGGQLLGVLAVQYDASDPTITLSAPLPAHIVAKGAPLSFKLDLQLFEATAFSVGNTVLDVTPDPQTADTTHIVGTPVYLELTSSTMERFRDKPFVTDGDESADLPGSVDLTDALGTRSLADLGTRAYSDLTGTPTVPADLDDLADVNAPTPTNGDVLTWDSTPGEWVAQAPAAVPSALDDLTDVDAPTPADGDVLTFDSGSGDWVAAAPTGSSGHYEILVTGASPVEPITNMGDTDYLYGLVG